MKKLNNKGLAPVIIVVIILAVVGIGFAGYRVYQNSKDKKNETATNTSQLNKSAEDKTVTSAQDNDSNKSETNKNAITDLNLVITSKADVEKLPQNTPDSFMTYLSNQFNTDPDDEGCLPAYSVTKISRVNIKGGEIRVSADGQNDSPDGACTLGGAPILWVLAPNNQWEVVTLNGVECASRSGGAVYEEFAPECYKDGNTSVMVKNPNGSIKLLKN